MPGGCPDRTGALARIQGAGSWPAELLPGACAKLLYSGLGSVAMGEPPTGAGTGEVPSSAWPRASQEGTPCAPLSSPGHSPHILGGLAAPPSGGVLAQEGQPGGAGRGKPSHLTPCPRVTDLRLWGQRLPLLCPRVRGRLGRGTRPTPRRCVSVSPVPALCSVIPLSKVLFRLPLSPHALSQENKLSLLYLQSMD